MTRYITRVHRELRQSATTSAGLVLLLMDDVYLVQETCELGEYKGFFTVWSDLQQMDQLVYFCR